MGSTGVDVKLGDRTKTASAEGVAYPTTDKSKSDAANVDYGAVSATASLVTVSPPSARTQRMKDMIDEDSSSSVPLGASWVGSSSMSISASRASELSSSRVDISDVVGSAPTSSSLMMEKRGANSTTHKAASACERNSFEETAPKIMSATAASRHDFSGHVRSAQSARNHSSTNAFHVPASASGSIDRRLIDKYERVNSEIERVIRSTNAGTENGELLKHVRSELRKVRKNSSQIIQSQKDLLEKMERQERGGFRRIFTINREHKMEKLRNRLCEKLNQAEAVDEQLDRLERQSVSLTRMSLGSMCGTQVGMEYDELSELEREREDLLNNLITSAGLNDAQELRSRVALFASEKRACESIMKQVEQCETLYRKALHLLRIALSTILAPTYTGGLKEFVLGPYPLAIEASQLIEQACRVIQPEARRRYKNFTPELSNVRPPRFPQPMIDFAKRGTRANFDPSNSGAIEAMRKLRTSENVVVLTQRIIIAKLELIDKWRRDVERDLERANDGHRKFDARLNEQMARLARSVSAA